MPSLRVYRLWLQWDGQWHQDLSLLPMNQEANLVWAQPQKYGTDLDLTVSYCNQMVMKKGYQMQSIQLAKTGSQPAKTKVAAFMGKIECKKYPMAVWNFMSKE